MHEQEERIRRRAHEIWLLEGKPEGREADHWFQAQEFIRTEDFLISVSTPNPALEADAVPVENVQEAGGAVADRASGAAPPEVIRSAQAVRAAGGSDAVSDRPTSKRTMLKKGMETFKAGAKPTRPPLPQWGGVR